jgi:hypothetical protein
MKLTDVFDFIARLYKPFEDSVIGKISWKELLSAVGVAILYLVYDESIATALKDFVNLDPKNTDQLASAIYVLILTLLHKNNQGKTNENKK